MKRLLAFFLSIPLLTTGCYTVTYTKPLAPGPIAFTGSLSKGAGGERTHFVEETTIWYALWGLVPISENDVTREVLDRRARQAAVENVTIKSEFSALDVLISLLTGVVTITRMTVRVEGDLVQPSEAVPLREPNRR